MEFLFAPSTAAAASSSAHHVTSSSTVAAVFNPTTASFTDHIYYNIWGWYSPRQKELVRRTLLLTGLIASETIVSTWGAIAGVEIQGALWYAGVWGMGSLVTGAVLDWVGGPSD